MLNYCQITINLKKNTIDAWANSLAKNGYATDPNYASFIKDMVIFLKLK